MKWKVEKEAGLGTQTRDSLTPLTGVLLLCPVRGKSEIAQVPEGETGWLTASLLAEGGRCAICIQLVGVGSPLGREPGAGRRLPRRAQPWARDRAPAVRTTSPASSALQPARSRGPAHSSRFSSTPRRTGSRFGSSWPGPWRAERPSAGPSGGAWEDAARGGPRAEQGPRASPKLPRPWEPQPPPRPRET